jgi:hypothetical protein
VDYSNQGEFTITYRLTEGTNVREDYTKHRQADTEAYLSYDKIRAEDHASPQSQITTDELTRIYSKQFVIRWVYLSSLSNLRLQNQITNAIAL